MSTFEIRLILYSVEQNFTETKELLLPSLPDSFQSIKEAIEEKYSIPACVQTLWIKERLIDNPQSTSPSSVYLKSGDILKITYPVKGEINRVKALLKWLSQCCTILSDVLKLTKKEDVKKLFSKHQEFLTDDSRMIFVQFTLFPSSVKSKWVNMMFFNDRGGIVLLAELHKRLHSILESKVHKPLHSFAESHQSLCCIAFALLSKDSEVRDKVTASGSLEACIQSFLRSSGRLKIDALCALCNISDLPSNQLYFSQRRDVIDQVFYMIDHPASYNNKVVIIALSLFLNVSECKDSHISLIKESNVKSMMTVMKKRSLSTEKDEVKIMRYYCALLQAQIIVGSETLIHSFSQRILLDMVELLKEVSTYSPDFIQSYEVKNGTYWDSFLFLFYFYEQTPCFIPPGSFATIVTELSLVAVEVLLLMLQSSIWNKDHIAVLVKQNILEYIIMLPWYVPTQLEENAIAVVRNIAKLHKYVQPPLLSSLCKAKLGKLKCGLRKLTEMRSYAQLLESISC